MPTMGAKWKQISPRWPELGSDPRTPHDRSPGRRCRPGSQPPLQQPSGRMSCKVMNPKTMTHLRSKVPNASKCIQMHPNASKCIQMHPNASKYTRCKQTAFKRAVLLQLSQHSVRSCCCESSCAMLWHYRTYRISTVVVKICHNISQYCALCQNMSPSSTIVRPAFSLTSGLYCKRKSMVWKTFLAEELMQKWHPDSGD